VIIVAGALYVSAGARTGYLDGCRAVVEQARAAVGCLDFALSADLVDERRINILERWATAQDLMRFRGSGPTDEQNDAIESADVQEFEVPDAS
jgi:quinol monooxygenase YgiN